MRKPFSEHHRGENPMSTRFRILVVDDEDSIRTSLARELRSEGYDVACAVDGVDATSLLTKEKYNLAIIDILMPKMDGMQLLRFIKSDMPALKVIMLTGHGSLADAIEAKKLGAEDFVSKPFDLTELLFNVDRVLSESP